MEFKAAEKTSQAMEMVISPELLENICKNTILTILLSLEHATKGTIYRIGPMPELRATRVTSGIREEGSTDLAWRLPGMSDYNYPGKAWEQYRDQSGRPLEAMAWCVERQKSWTSDDPYQNKRSVQRQVWGQVEDFHHMEPVLVRKWDLYGNRIHSLQYPIDINGDPIWQDTEYVVVAVIKIHFLPHTIKRGDRSTKVIKHLSRTLGTEMLSLHLRESLLLGRQELSRQRLQTCNVLAHELRNALTKLSFAFSAINAEISFLRDLWEIELRRAFPWLEDKRGVVKRLNESIQSGLAGCGSEELESLARHLLRDQEELAALSLLPHQEDHWLKERIQPKWARLLAESSAWNADSAEVMLLLEQLKKSFSIGMNEDLAAKLSHLPEELRRRWPSLVYTHYTAENLSLLDEILELLQDAEIPLPLSRHTRKVFTSLRALVKTIPEIEERTNIIISCLRAGISLDAQ